MSVLRLSPSRINAFERCQLQYRYRYLEDRVKPPGVAAAIGTATHKSVELNLKHKFETGEALPEDVVTDAAAQAAENEWSGGLVQDDDKPLAKGDVIDEAVALSRCHYTDVAQGSEKDGIVVIPEVKPVAVERAFGVEISSDIRLTGHIDVQEAERIRDTKTIKASPSAIKGEHANQLQLYAVGVLVNDGKLPSAARVDYLVKNKKAKKAVSHEIPVTEESAQRALDRLSLTSRVIARAIESGDFMPAPADSWACSKKWCGYYDECPFGALKRTQG